MNQRKIIFFHLPKTAGTSVKLALTSSFGEDKVDLIYGREFFNQKLEAFLQAGKSLGIGHMPWLKEYNALLSGYTKITFLRHPVYRTISHYLHVKYSSDPDHTYFKQMNFPEFLATNAGSNDMTRRLGGGFYQEEVPADVFYEEARENVVKRFDFVGTTENMVKDWKRLKKVLRKRLKPVDHLNQGSFSEEALLLRTQYETEIIAANTLDLKLYDLAKSRS